jgi:UDP-N-acetylmuramate--alanine ligase
MKQRHVHFIGIKGVAMTALAIVAQELGAKVTGSDVEEDFPTADVLNKYHLTPQVGFTKENLIEKPDLVVVTGGHGGMNNPEAVAAKKLGLRVLMHGQALGEFCQEKKTIAVAGCHGKTTTAAIIAHLLTKNRLDPSFAIGCGEIKSLRAAGHAGKGDYFVVEADEYVTDPGSDPTPRFFWLSPFMAVITNIEYDHPDAYRNLEQLKSAFLTFTQKIPSSGLLVLGIDNQNNREILRKISCPVVTYGFSPEADYQISQVSFTEGRTRFWLKKGKVDLGQFSLAVPGKHNALNFVAASLVVNSLGISWENIRREGPSFLGTKRRFEFKGEKGGAIFYDDYAHHPTEIAATLAAARAAFSQRRIICIFQPHTFSRTKALFSEFSRCFTEASEVILVDIYPSAREKPDPTINSQILALEMQHYHQNVRYLGSLGKAISYLKERATHNDVIITMGAGDVYKIHQMLFQYK